MIETVVISILRPKLYLVPQMMGSYSQCIYVPVPLNMTLLGKKRIFANIIEVVNLRSEHSRLPRMGLESNGKYPCKRLESKHRYSGGGGRERLAIVIDQGVSGATKSRKSRDSFQSLNGSTTLLRQ